MLGVTGFRDPAGLLGLQRLNRFLDDAFAGMPEQNSVITSAWFAPTDVSEDESGIQISMELPGVNPDDVRLSLENNVLTIRGEKQQREEKRNERVHRFERTYGAFERTFLLPNTVDSENIDARYENGVLFITIPKAERAKPREIRVKSSAGSSRVSSGAQQHRVTSQTGESNQAAQPAAAGTR